MEDNLEDLKQKNMWSYYEHNVIDPIVKLNIPDVTEEDIHRIIGIILTNSFETSGKNIRQLTTDLQSWMIENYHLTSES